MSEPIIESTGPMTVDDLMVHLILLHEQGHGDLPVYTASDDEGNSYNALWFDPEVKDPEDEDYVDEYGWHEDWPESKLVVL